MPLFLGCCYALSPTGPHPLSCADADSTSQRKLWELGVWGVIDLSPLNNPRCVNSQTNTTTANSMSDNKVSQIWLWLFQNHDVRDHYTHSGPMSNIFWLVRLCSRRASPSVGALQSLHWSRTRMLACKHPDKPRNFTLDSPRSRLVLWSAEGNVCSLCWWI